MAKDAMKNAYAPYSNFKVGAALETEDGHFYIGCNIENASYGATNCAERTAIFKAVSEGHIKIKQIAIVSDSGKETPPCGICLQVLSEFMPPDGTVLLENQGVIKRYQLSDFLPKSFAL
jgi:cytidine deaminase